MPTVAGSRCGGFASLIPAGDVLLLLMKGLTLDDKGIACYGCDDSPVSFCAYRLTGQDAELGGAWSPRDAGNPRHPHPLRWVSAAVATSHPPVGASARCQGGL